MEQLQTIIQKHCFIENKDEVATMLNFYHDLGVIVKHGNTVILRAEWLIKLFKQLITVRCFDDMVRRKHQLHFHTLKQQCGFDLEYDLASPSVCWSCFFCYVSAGLTCSIYSSISGPTWLVGAMVLNTKLTKNSESYSST